jgi:hypothetical protein
MLNKETIMLGPKIKKGYKKSAFEGIESYRKAWLALIVISSLLIASQVNSNPHDCA